MGVDYIRFRLKPGVDREALQSLIDRQALAFQSMWGSHSNASYHVNGMTSALQKQLHYQTYCDSSHRLREFIDLPEWNDDLKAAKDIPNLRPSFRMSAISDTGIFPPLWRMQSYRTILPEELPGQLDRWTNWIREVSTGQHDDYLCRLHMHETSDFLYYHWSSLRGLATASLEKTTNWANKPQLQPVRDEILRLPEPVVYEAPIEPSETGDQVPQQQCDALFEDVRNLLRLSREWSRNVSGNWKMPNYTENYVFTLTDFKACAAREFLTEFLDWAKSCVNQGFGLFLDY